jgi:glutathione S-transferase
MVLEAFQIPYSAEYINLFPAGQTVYIPPATPAGLVPALTVTSLNNTTLHDSLAILEFLAETYPQLWPQDRKLRALARCVANEMHAGFGALRNNYGANYMVKYPKEKVPLVDGAQKELRRLAEIWEGARIEAKAVLGEKDEGFLFGGFSIGT